VDPQVDDQGRERRLHRVLPPTATVTVTATLGG
jgi:hypothetical protein